MASKAAANAKATYTLGLDDQISAPAKNAAGSIEALRKRLAGGKKELGDVTRQMRELKGSGSGGTEVYKQLAARAKALREANATTAKSILDLGGSLSDGTKKSAGFLKSVSGAPGPLGGMAASVSRLTATLGQAGGAAVLGAGAIVAVVAALGALAIAAGAATLALYQYGIAQSDARRTELLHLEGLVSIRNHYGIAAGSAAQLQGAIDRVSASSALGRTETSRYAEQLYRLGLRGSALSDALDGVTIVASVQGDRFAQRFAGMAASAALTGGSVRRLADDVRTRLGGIAQRQAMGLTAQMQRMREASRFIFGGLRIEGPLRALNEITSALSATSVTGRALRSLVSTLFNPLLDAIGGQSGNVREFFEGMVIQAQRVAIAVMRVAVGVLRIGSAVSSELGLSRLRELVDVTGAGRLAVLGLAAALITAGVVAGTLALAVGVVAASVALLAAPLLIVVAAFVAAWEAGARLGSWLRDTDWSAIGASLVDGLVRGIGLRREQVTMAVRGLASAATDALRSALGIRSPSRVFASLGVHVSQGLAQGVDRGAPAAERAVTRMSAGLTRGVVDDAPALPSSSVTSSSTSIGPFFIQLAPGTTEAQAEDFRDQLARALEGVSFTRGIPT